MLALSSQPIPGNTPSMLKSYFTIALRNFLRNKVTSIINISGLMLGLTTSIVICLLLVYAFGFDKFHANYKDIHLVELNLRQTGSIVTYSSTPGPLRAAIEKTIPGLKYVVRTEEAGDAPLRRAWSALNCTHSVAGSTLSLPVGI
jgi:putative ABC transport system permease protein